MVISLAVALIGSVVAAVGTGVITVRCIRSPRADLICIAVALLGLTVALGAMTLGNLRGFGSGTFRAMELGAQVLAPLALCLGLAEMAGRRIGVRFAARLILSALAVIALVILSSDQLNPTAAFSKAWPAAAVHYETIPNNLLKLGLAPVTALIALIAIGVAAGRASRDPAWQPAAVTVGSAAAAALALAIPAAVTMPSGSVFAIACLAAASLASFAGIRAGSLRSDARGDRRADEDHDGWGGQDSWAGHIDQTGDFDALVAGGEGVYRGNGLYRPDAGRDHDSGPSYRPDDDYDDDYQRDGPDVGYPGDGYGSAELNGQHAGSGYGGDEPEPSYSSNGRGRPAPDARYDGYGDDADHSEAVPDGADAGMPAADDEAQGRLFGQIAIYTLLEDRVGEFDLLTERVVEQVRAREPDTLVYIVHAVPSAPMQRILYEVYSDRAAYDQHRRQPYVTRFEIDRRPYVLATNVIELGLQQAKVSPLPSIADLLGPSGPASDFIQAVPGRHPGPGQSGYSHPGPSHSGPGHPGPAQHGTGQAHYGEPGYREPGHGEPGYSEPAFGEPGYSEPGYDEQPAYDESRYDSGGYDSAGYDSAGYDSAGYDSAGYDERGYDERGYDEAGHSEPGYGSEPGYDKPHPDGPGESAGPDEGTRRRW